MGILSSRCVICGVEFEAQHSYGLCPKCWSKDRLRELDRLQSAIRATEKLGLSATLSLCQWICLLSDFKAMCAFCLVVPFSSICVVRPSQGLVYGNVVPACRACMVHKQAGSFELAEARVSAYLAGTREDDLYYHGEEEGIDPDCLPDTFYELAHATSGWGV